jgi:hypothetical protein
LFEDYRHPLRHPERTAWDSLLLATGPTGRATGIAAGAVRGGLQGGRVAQAALRASRALPARSRAVRDIREFAKPARGSVTARAWAGAAANEATHAIARSTGTARFPLKRALGMPGRINSQRRKRQGHAGQEAPPSSRLRSYPR